MTTSGAAVTYRYVGDGRLTRPMAAGIVRQLLDARRWAALAAVGQVWGIAAAVHTAAARLRDQGVAPLGELTIPSRLGVVVWTGMGWGLTWTAVTAAFLVVVLPLVAFVGQVSILEQLFPPGSVAEVELHEEALVVRRPSDTRTVPYGAIHSLRAKGAFLDLRLSGPVRVARLPRGILPDGAIDAVRAAARQAGPTAPDGGADVTRSFVVPDGWPGHVAWAVTRTVLGRLGTWARITLLMLVAALVSQLTHPVVLAGVGLLVLTAHVSLHLGVRRATAAGKPAGFVTSTLFGEDGFVVRSAWGGREIRFADVVSIECFADLVCLGLQPADQLTIERELIPDDALAALRERTAPA